MFNAIVRSEVGAISDVIVKVTAPPSMMLDRSDEIFRVGFVTTARRLEPLEVGTACVTIKAAVFSRPTE